jgi:EmrB/QacA subfamily drug resistance transporter
MKSPRSPFYVTTLIAGAFFMENLDGTIIATALPQMAKSFGVGAVRLNIGMTAYLITLAVFIPISGWVADRFGARTVFASAIGIFTFASLLCAAAPNLTIFTLTRILQGIGGSMMVPVGRLIVLRTTPKDRIAQAIAYISWPGLAALVIGPPIGGFITTYFSWHWIFLLNLPIGIIALVLTTLWIENTRSEEKHPLDWVTFLFAGLASTGVVFALETLGGGDSHWIAALNILILSLLSAYLAIVTARRNPTSLIDMQSLRLKSYRLSVYSASLFRIAVGVLPFLLPLMFQVAFGLSAFASGLYLLALFGGDFSMKSIVLPVLRRFGFRRLLIFNGIIVAVSVALCATFTPHTPPALVAALLFFHGASRSLEFTCMTTLAYAEIPPERMSRANGFLSAVMQLSMGMGVAVGAVILRLVARASGHLPANPHLRDFQIAILCTSVLALAPAIEAIGLPRNAGAMTSGHQTDPDFEFVPPDSTQTPAG